MAPPGTGSPQRGIDPDVDGPYDINDFDDPAPQAVGRHDSTSGQC